MGVLKRVYDAVINKKPAVVGTAGSFKVKGFADLIQLTKPIRSFDAIPNAGNYSSAMGVYTGWQNSVASIGTNNSLSQYNTFIMNRLSYQECAYLSNDPFISRAVNVIVSEIFKEGGVWNDVKGLGNFDTICRRFGLDKTIRTACLRALEYGGAMIYIDTSDEDTSEPLRLNEWTLSTSRLKGFRVVEPWQFAPVLANAFNPLLADYMKPTLWWVNGASHNVHHSRLIPLTFFTVVDLLKPIYNYLGLPLAFFMRDFVSSAETSRKCVADMLLRFKTDYLKTTAQKIANPETKARIKFMNESRNNFGTVLLAEDEEMAQMVTPISGLGEIVTQQYEILTAITGLPITKFLGQTPKGFNSTGEHDMDNHYDTIAGYQTNIVRPVFDNLAAVICHLSLGIAVKPEYKFNPIDRLSAKEKVEIANLNMDVINKAIEAGIATAQDALKAIQTNNFTFDWVNAEDLAIIPDDEAGDELQGFDGWDEEKHPRRDDGKFGSGDEKESGENKSDEEGELFGKAYKEYSHKPEKAIEHLLKVKNGHVPAAINKEGIGDIDFVWGNDEFGLQHIIYKRNRQNQDGEKFVKSLPDLIRNGVVYSNRKQKNKTYIGTKDKEIVIRLDWFGEDKKWLITAYKRYEELIGL